MNRENNKVLDFNKFKKKKKVQIKKQKKEYETKKTKIFFKEMLKALNHFGIRLLLIADILILIINCQIDSQVICITCTILVYSIIMAISETSNKLDENIII